MQNFCLSEVLLERFQSASIELGHVEQIVELDASKLDTWIFRDRKAFELGNIEELAQSIKLVGQCQPIIVVRTSEAFMPKDNSGADYVVIAGYRRWIACKNHNLQVKALIKSINFDQALGILVSENEKENVSDYSKGMFYSSLLQKENVSEEELCRSLNISSNQLALFLSFSQVPPVVWEAVGDLSHVSAKTAHAIVGIVNKGTMYVEALVSVAKKIAQGYGEKRITQAVEKIIDKKLNRISSSKGFQSKLEFDGKSIVNILNGKIKIDDALFNHNKYPELVSKIKQTIQDFAQVYLAKK